MKAGERVREKFKECASAFCSASELKGMELAGLRDCYIHELKDLCSAEKRLVQALPKMAKAAHNEELAAGIQKHLEQTKEHVARLEKILAAIPRFYRTRWSRNRVDKPLEKAAPPEMRQFYRDAARAPSHEEIALLAHQIYLARGRIPGHEVEDWLEAERQLSRRNRLV
jgi:thioredoxin-like negative regulator of GroEL